MEMRMKVIQFLVIALLCSLVMVLPAAAATGGKIAFNKMVGSGDEFYNQIFVMKDDGTGITQLSFPEGGVAGANAMEPAWSPDGTKIAFVGEGWDHNQEIWVMKSDGSGQQNIFFYPGQQDGNPVWSPDGTKIAYHHLTNEKSEIWVADADGKNRVLQTSAYPISTNPAWSPDGKWIAFESYFEDEGLDIYATTVVGPDPSWQLTFRLTDDPAEDVAPAWSPDGTQIAFTSTREYAMALYVMDVTNLASIPPPVLLTPTTVNVGSPAWSPDGSSIVLTSDDKVCVINLKDYTGVPLIPKPITEGMKPSWWGPKSSLDSLELHVSTLFLPVDIEKGLLDKLNAAETSTQGGHSRPAINQLTAFKNQVKAQKGKQIPVSDANLLLEEATSLQKYLSG